MNNYVKKEDYNRFLNGYNKKQSFLDTIKFSLYIGSKNMTLDDKISWCSKELYRFCRYYPNIRKPSTFNEWINWYKLFYADNLMTYCVDKYTFKNYVSEKVGDKYVCKLYAAFSDVNELDNLELPHEYVIKSNVSSGGQNVLRISSPPHIHATRANKDRLKARLANWLLPWQNIYYHTFDWAYRDINPLIIIEEYLTDKKFDIKIFCFGGNPEFLYVDSDSLSKTFYSNCYDTSWNPLPVRRHGQPFPYPVNPPDYLPELLRIASILSKPFPHARVDFMVSDTEIKLSEITFYTGSGFHGWNPMEWDGIFGKYFNFDLFDKAHCVNQ